MKGAPVNYVMSRMLLNSGLYEIGSNLNEEASLHNLKKNEWEKSQCLIKEVYTWRKAFSIPIHLNAWMSSQKYYIVNTECVCKEHFFF